jgi:hypothetical protein
VSDEPKPVTPWPLAPSTNDPQALRDFCFKVMARFKALEHTYHSPVSHAETSFYFGQLIGLVFRLTERAP